MLVGSTIQQRLVLALTGEYPDLFQDQLPGPDHQQKCPPSMQEGKTSNVYFNTKRQCLQKSINGSILPFFGPKDIHSRCIITQVTPLTYLLDLGMNIDGYALVVGGASGIGKACCLAFAGEGAAGVMVADINLEAAQTVAAECAALGGTRSNFRAQAVHMDVTKEDSVAAATAETVSVFGRIDYCVNSSGIGVEQANEVADAVPAEFARFLDVNVMGMFLVTRAVSAAMRGQDPRPVDAACAARGTWRGSIVNMGSAASFASSPGMVQYTTSKFAVLGLTKNAALDNAVHGIRVNCVCPSWVDTPMVQRAIENVQGLGDFITNAVPMGRIAQTGEIADVVLFLSSPRSSYVTGCGFLVDGGTTLTCHT